MGLCKSSGFQIRHLDGSAIACLAKLPKTPTSSLLGVKGLSSELVIAVFVGDRGASPVR